MGQVYTFSLFSMPRMSGSHASHVLIYASLASHGSHVCLAASHVVHTRKQV